MTNPSSMEGKRSWVLMSYKDNGKSKMRFQAIESQIPYFSYYMCLSQKSEQRVRPITDLALNQPWDTCMYFLSLSPPILISSQQLASNQMPYSEENLTALDGELACVTVLADWVYHCQRMWTCPCHWNSQEKKALLVPSECGRASSTEVAQVDAYERECMYVCISECENACIY